MVTTAICTCTYPHPNTPYCTCYHSHSKYKGYLNINIQSKRSSQSGTDVVLRSKWLGSFVAYTAVCVDHTILSSKWLFVTILYSSKNCNCTSVFVDKASWNLCGFCSRYSSRARHLLFCFRNLCFFLWCFTLLDFCPSHTRIVLLKCPIMLVYALQKTAQLCRNNCEHVIIVESRHVVNLLGCELQLRLVLSAT